MLRELPNQNRTLQHWSSILKMLFSKLSPTFLFLPVKVSVTIPWMRLSFFLLCFPVTDTRGSCQTGYKRTTSSGQYILLWVPDTFCTNPYCMLTSKDQSILKSNLNPSFRHLIALPVCAEKYIMKKICMQKWSICFGSRKKVPHWKPSTEHSDNHHSHPENKVWQKNLFILTLKHSTWFMNYTQCQITLTRPPSSISN